MAERLILVAHGATAGIRDLVFGDQGVLTDPGAVEPMASRVASWSSGPEPACVETARALGGEPEVLTDLAGPDVGDWTGRTLTSVGAEDPPGLGAWLCDPAATPHGGESLAALIERTGAYCDQHGWAQGRNVVVVTPLVARALAVHALGAPPEVFFRIDLAPLGRVGLSRHGSHWRLQRLG